MERKEMEARTAIEGNNNKLISLSKILFLKRFFFGIYATTQEQADEWHEVFDVPRE